MTSKKGQDRALVVGQRAVVVSRISSLTEVTTSPDSQRSRGDAEAARLDMEVVGYAEDLDVSASKFSPWDRPELGKWLNQSSTFDALIFRAVDRVARDIHDFVQLLKWSEDEGKRLVCMEPNIDFSTPIGKAFGVLLAVFAEMESKAISARVTGARTYMRSIARWGAGRPPDGYRLCTHPSGTGFALEPDPERGPIILEAVQRAIDGESVLSICRDLNTRGIDSPETALRKRRAANGGKGKPVERQYWHPRTLTLILRSDSLRNYVTHDGRPVRGDDGLPLRYGEPLVDDRQFRDLQAVLDKHARPERRRRGDAAPLLGVLFCAECERRLYRNASSGGKSKQPNIIYRCATSYRGLGDCPGCSVSEEDAQDFVSGNFLRLVGRLPLLIKMEDPGENHNAEIRELEEALDELERDRYEGGLFRGEDGRQRFREQYTRIEKRLETLRALPSRPPGVRYEETGLTYGQEWEVADWQRRRTLLLDRSVRVEVTGRTSDGMPTSERLTFSARGFDDEELAVQGHDETDPREHW